MIPSYQGLGYKIAKTTCLQDITDAVTKDIFSRLGVVDGNVSPTRLQVLDDDKIGKQPGSKDMGTEKRKAIQ
jgi:hypothetical protein